jgi:hypothetical protein
MSDKITLYNKSGGKMEVDDTPQRREWAKGKGYVLDAPPSKAKSPTPPPRPASEGD